jgi:hypothetical protein
MTRRGNCNERKRIRGNEKNEQKQKEFVSQELSDVSSLGCSDLWKNHKIYFLQIFNSLKHFSKSRNFSTESLPKPHAKFFYHY